ncbi:MAG: sugar phosphate isomerase/epimerase family protein [Nitrospirota bacterium]
MSNDMFPGRAVHVHVPYQKFFERLDFLRENRINPELFFLSGQLDKITRSDIEALRASMDWSPTVSIHAPFMDLCPGAVDSKVGAVTLERYLQTLEVTAPLKPLSVVFHSGYERWKYAGNVDIWLSRSMAVWRKVLQLAEKTGVKVAVENIVDSEPAHLVRLAEEINHPLFGLCFDIGHRELFSKLTPVEWLDPIAPWLFELHLHDNSGVEDDHLPIGGGKIEFGEFFKRLRELELNPVYTLEAHSEKDAMESLASLRKFIK